MGRLKVTPKGKIKKNIPITRIGRKQYLKRRFAHVHKVDLAGIHNSLTQKYVKSHASAIINYTRLGLSADPSLPAATVAERKRRVKPHLREEMEAAPATRGSVGMPVSEHEGTMLANLIERYGDDFRGMSLDLTLNPMQLTPRQLQRKVANYVQWERAAFPAAYEEAAAAGTPLDDYRDPALRSKSRDHQRDAATLRKCRLGMEATSD